MDPVIHFLSALSSTVLRVAVVCFVLVNGAAILAFALSKNRRLVNTWTPKIVTIDALLLGAGLGVPLLATVAKFGVRALAGMAGGLLGLFK